MRSSALATATLLAAALASACTARDMSSSNDVAARLARYTTVPLVVDSSALTPKERQMLPILMDAAHMMDPIFRMQAYASYDSLMLATADSNTRRLIAINYGPWDRLDSETPFVLGVGAKPAGANFYPADMSKAEFEAAIGAGTKARGDSLKGLYTLVRRGTGAAGGAMGGAMGGDPGGALDAVPYHVAFKSYHEAAAAKLREAAVLAEDAGLRRYLTARAEALLTDDYRASDLAWMEMKSNTLDIIIGPIETYEDALFGYKAGAEAYVLIKDKSWSARLSKYAAMLPSLQRGLPVADAYKRERPGTESDLNAYDAVYYSGEANAGAKTIAINLPNDEEVQLAKGTRRLQLKNVMRAKFDKILIPIADELVATDQVGLIHFDSFFENTMFHEVAHGLGIKRTLDGKSTVREALKERASALEEGKADILGLYMVQALSERGELSGQNAESNYVSFLAGLFRSVRFGGGDAHGRANIAAFNFLAEQGAFARDATTGQYRVDFAKMRAGMNALTATILTLQGDGDYAGVGKFQEQYGTISAELQADLDRLGTKGIPVDVVFEQERRATP